MKTPNTQERVVVTGMGIVCPLGHDVETLWQALLSGRSGAGKTTIFDASTFGARSERGITARRQPIEGTSKRWKRPSRKGTLSSETKSARKCRSRPGFPMSTTSRAKGRQSG